MHEIIEKNIENKIYEIRGVQVMLDSDLAKLYHVETKRINEAVRNNPIKFPERYCFNLSLKEYDTLRSKISTLNGRGQHRKYLPKVFTEQGVYMLATVLKSNIASEVTINIMDTFVKMRKIIKNNLLEQQYINELVLEHDKDIKLLQETFNKFEKKEKINKIFFEGEIYDAYSLLMDILNKSYEEIIIIDNYAGKELLDILKNTNKKITIVSSNIDNVLKKKYESQYNNITFINNTGFHDRFIIIDKEILYTCGSSFKDLGKKCFSISRFDDKEYLNKILISIKV